MLTLYYYFFIFPIIIRIISTYPDDAVWSISGHDCLRLQNAIGFLGWDICLNDPVLRGPPDVLGPPPLPWGVTIRGMQPTLPVLAERLDDVATAAAATVASSPSGPDSLDSENRFGLKFKFATLLVTIWWRDVKKLILLLHARSVCYHFILRTENEEHDYNVFMTITNNYCHMRQTLM